MRVRVNFTLEVDAESYRDAMGDDISKETIRRDIQERAQKYVTGSLKGIGVDAGLLSRNNVYSPEDRLTGRVSVVGS